VRACVRACVRASVCVCVCLCGAGVGWSKGLELLVQKYEYCQRQTERETLCLFPNSDSHRISDQIQFHKFEYSIYFTDLLLVFLLTTLPDAYLPALVSVLIMLERLATNLSPHKYDRLSVGLPISEQVHTHKPETKLLLTSCVP
jgi:hypothetical protein